MKCSCYACAFIVLGSLTLYSVIHSYCKKAHSIQTTGWRPSTCQLGATRITKEKKVRHCSEHGCSFYHCYTPEVEVTLEGKSEKVWAKEFHEESDEDCWLYRPLAQRWLVENRYDQGKVRSCMYDVSNHRHVKFSPTRAPIHWWTWLWYFWQSALGALMLLIGIAYIFERWDFVHRLFFSCSWCCNRPGHDETTPLMGNVPQVACQSSFCTASITFYHLAWFVLALGVAFLGPSTWQGSHPGITGTMREFQQTWSQWAQGDQEFLDHMVKHCDMLYLWTVIGIAISEAFSLVNCAIRYCIGAKAPPALVFGWLMLLDMWPVLASSSISKQICITISSTLAVIARFSVIIGLLQWGDNYGGLSSYIVDSRNSVVHCCDLSVLCLALTWIFVSITSVLITPFLIPFSKFDGVQLVSDDEQH